MADLVRCFIESFRLCDKCDKCDSSSGDIKEKAPNPNANQPIIKLRDQLKKINVRAHICRVKDQLVVEVNQNMKNYCEHSGIDVNSPLIIWCPYEPSISLSDEANEHNFKF